MQCASCPYLQTGVLVGHCCRRCPSGKGHGPLCERRSMVKMAVLAAPQQLLPLHL
tara:strand:+ start:116 stop:280 length:165 start_codon:yes stop_codon:yes gene_type:complete